MKLGGFGAHRGVHSGSTSSGDLLPAWADCAGLSPELHCWRLQVGNLSIDTDGR